MEDLDARQQAVPAGTAAQTVAIIGDFAQHTRLNCRSLLWAVCIVMQEGDELCLEAADLMLQILGAEASHMGVRLLSTGGVYLTGI